MNCSIADQLEEAISARKTSAQCAPHQSDPRIQQLLAVAEEMRHLPRPEFRARLRTELQTAANHRTFNRSLDILPAPSRPRGLRESVVPPLFSTGSSTFPVRGSHLALSFALHVAALSLVVASGWWMVENRAVVRMTVG